MFRSLKAHRTSNSIQLWLCVVSFSIYKYVFLIYRNMSFSRFIFVCPYQIEYLKILLVLTLIFIHLFDHFFVHLKSHSIRNNIIQYLIVLGYVQNYRIYPYRLCVGCHFINYKCDGFSPIFGYYLCRNRHTHRVNFPGSPRGTEWIFLKN